MSFTYAFFDFDETVFRHKSMFEFAQYYLEAIDELHGVSRFKDLMDDIDEMASQGYSRGEVNRFYYSQFAGHSQAWVKEIAARWYASLQDSSEPCLIEPVVDEVHELREQGVTLVLVSGAFEPILRPFADHLGFTELICSSPAVRDGLYTGELSGEPVIGDEKAARVAKFLAARDIAAEGCYAVGDHISDAPLLELVGTATVVNPAPGLEAMARERGWSIVRG